MMLKRPPVENVLDDGVLAVHAMVLCARAATALGRLFDHAVAVLPAGTLARRGDEVPDGGARAGEVRLEHGERVVPGDHAPSGFVVPRPRLFEVARPAGGVADVLDRLDVPGQALSLRIDLHRLRAGVGVERKGARGEGAHDVVLEQPVDEDHVPAGELLAAPIFCRMNSP